MDDDEEMVGLSYDGSYMYKQKKSKPEPRTMVDYCDRSTEGIGQGFNADFESCGSSYMGSQPTESSSSAGESEIDPLFRIAAVVRSVAATVVYVVVLVVSVRELWRLIWLE